MSDIDNSLDTLVGDDRQQKKAGTIDYSSGQEGIDAIITKNELQSD
jgi:hypothetical protein